MSHERERASTAMPTTCLWTRFASVQSNTVWEHQGGALEEETIRQRRTKLKRVCMAMGHPREKSWDIDNSKCMEVNFTIEHATRRGRSLLASTPYSNHKEEDGMSIWS